MKNVKVQLVMRSLETFGKTPPGYGRANALATMRSQASLLTSDDAKDRRLRLADKSSLLQLASQVQVDAKEADE